MSVKIKATGELKRNDSPDANKQSFNKLFQLAEVFAWRL